MFGWFSYFRRVELKLDKVLSFLKEFRMSVSQDLKNLTQQIDAATNAVAARLTALSNQLKNNMTDEELNEVKAGLQAQADRLTTLGQDPDNPVPPA